MIENAAESDKKRVLTINKSYEKLSLNVYSKLEDSLRLQYDNCRKSCILSVTMLKD